MQLKKHKKIYIGVFLFLIILVMLWIPGMDRFKKINANCKFPDFEFGQTLESFMSTIQFDTTAELIDDYKLKVLSSDGLTEFWFIRLKMNQLGVIFTSNSEYEMYGVKVGMNLEEIEDLLHNQNFTGSRSSYSNDFVVLSIYLDSGDNAEMISMETRLNLTPYDSLIRLFSHHATLDEYNHYKKLYKLENND